MAESTVDLPSVESVDSPCVDVCELDSDFVCIGCGRTIEEILKWPYMDHSERQQTLDRIFEKGEEGC